MQSKESRNRGGRSPKESIRPSTDGAVRWAESDVHLQLHHCDKHDSASVPWEAVVT